MVKLNYLLNLDNHWEKIKEWWINIHLSNELFPKQFRKTTIDEKNFFKINFLYVIKKIFDIDDLNNINKININNYDINKLIDNFKLNIDIFKEILNNDIELKNIIFYILNFKDYFNLIKKKMISIVEPLLNEIYFDKLFRCDNDLTRLCCPIVASIVYIYIIKRDIETTINLFLVVDIISIQFFVVSYLILDNFMDDQLYYKEHKLIFFKWFMKIVNEPEKEVILNEEQNEIWQCILFKKYFCMFVNKYPVNKNKVLYDFVKLMISTLKSTDNIQKNSNITEDTILECTFKKSYVACFFMAIIMNKQIKNKLKKSEFYLLCKLVFLVQIYDDYVDIDKDTLENNYTYYNCNNSNINFNNKIKKIILAGFIFLKNLEEKNNNINNIIRYFLKHTILYGMYINIDKFDQELIDYLLEYSSTDLDIFKYFDTKSYNQYESKLLLNIFKNYILNNL
jgi:hypothetical protein